MSTYKMPLKMSVRVFPERFHWGRKSHPGYGQPAFDELGEAFRLLGWLKRRRLASHQQLSFLDPKASMWSHVSCFQCHTFLPRVDFISSEIIAQNETFLAYGQLFCHISNKHHQYNRVAHFGSLVNPSIEAGGPNICFITSTRTH